jgi:hypothetical protein
MPADSFRIFFLPIYCSDNLKIKISRNGSCIVWVRNLVAHIKGNTQENRPRVFENRVLRKISESNSEEVTEGFGENCLRRSVLICAAHQTSFG